MPNGLQSLILPLVGLMSLERVIMGYKEFKEKVNEVYKSVSLAEKKVILNFAREPKKARYNSTFSFKVN